MKKGKICPDCAFITVQGAVNCPQCTASITSVEITDVGAHSILVVNDVDTPSVTGTDRKVFVLPLSIFGVVADVLNELYEQKIVLFEKLFMWGVIISCIYGYTAFYQLNDKEIEYFILMTISLISYTYIAIIVHRTILLGSDSTPRWGFFLPRLRELKYCGWAFGVIVIFMIVIFILMTILGVISELFRIRNEIIIYSMMVPIFIISLATMTKLMLVLPLTAIDQKTTLAESAQLTKGNRFEVFLLLGAIPGMLNFFLEQYKVQTLSLTLSIIFGLVSLLLMVIQISLISVTYKNLKDNIILEYAKRNRGVEKRQRTFKSPRKG